MLRSRWILPVLILAALILRLQGLNWDAGRGLHPDEGNLVRAATSLGWGKLVPDFHAYNDLALWLPKLAALPFCDTTSEHCLRLSARALSALFSTAAVGVMALLAGRLAGRGAALATALAAGASAPLIQWAHFGTTESALILLVAALWLQTVRWQHGATGTTGMALGTALLLGLGFGLKTSALVMAVIPLIALVLAGRPDAACLRALAWAVPLTVLVAVVATPSLIFATQDWLATMRFENGVVTGVNPVFWTRQFRDDFGPAYQLRQLWGGTGGVGLLLALVGLVLAPRSAWRGLAPGLGFAILYAGLTFGWHAAFFRYLAPVFPVVLVLAGIGVAQVFDRIPWQSARALVGAGLAFMALTGLDLAASYQARDPRLLAEADLTAHARPGDVVAVEPHDTALTGGLDTVVLPLDGADPIAIATGLAGADWLLVASRRNWAVLPRVPDEAPLACGYYLALLRGELGFRPVATFRRASPFGALLEPGLGGEETRTVFDRPTLTLLRNETRLDAVAIATRITAPAKAEECSPQALAALWGRTR
ncbi:MAG: hypothetical protein NTW20_12365 [Rhodobacterales bacterium]|nr:hypothetical protein [Rhodobacterales bacterium]